MGRAMLIIVAGMIIALGYVFIGMSNQRKSMTKHSTSTANKALAQNMSSSGVQFAINEYDKNGKWSGPKSFDFEYGRADVSIAKNGNIIEVTSTGNVDNSSEEHTIRTTLEVNESGSIPTFNSALTLATKNFQMNLNGAFSINGNASVSGCGNKPAVTVQDNQSKSYVENQEPNGGPPSGGINGNPDIAVDSDMSYAPLAKTVSQLEKNAIKIQDKWDVLQSNPSNPKTFVLDNGAQLNGNAKGYGIMIVKDGGRINGTFEFNGLVIFEDEDALLANGTADIKGSVIVGSTGENDEEDEEDGDSSIDIDISGNMNIEYDCQTQKYADMAAKKSAQTTYSMLNVYE